MPNIKYLKHICSCAVLCAMKLTAKVKLQPTEEETEGALGVDMGVTNIVTISDGEIATSEIIERNRRRHQRLRRGLQRARTRSAKRHLRKLAGRQARFQTDINHCISKQLVQNAKHTKRVLALEDLKGIRTRTRVRGADARAKHSNWTFAQLGMFIGYKARRAGVTVKVVDPAYTSQRCFACGHLEPANRKSQSQFQCCRCGHSDHADINAAKNIGTWATVISPIVTSVQGKKPASVTSPRL